MPPQPLKARLKCLTVFKDKPLCSLLANNVYTAPRVISPNSTLPNIGYRWTVRMCLRFNWPDSFDENQCRFWTAELGLTLSPFGARSRRESHAAQLEPMRKQVEGWQRSELTDVTAKGGHLRGVGGGQTGSSKTSGSDHGSELNKVLIRGEFQCRYRFNHKATDQLTSLQPTHIRAPELSILAQEGSSRLSLP